MAATFDEIVRAWLLHYDDRLPSDRKSRREAFIILLGNLADHGFGKEDLNVSKKDKIIRSCVNLNHKNKSKLKKWISITVNDLEAAIIIYYPTITIRNDVVTSEMEAKLEGMEQKAEESKKLRTEDSDDEDDSGFENESIESILGESEEKPKKTTKEKTFKITDEILGEDDGPEVIYDKDFMKRLGLE